VISFTGQVGITLHILWCEPKEDTEEHKAACERQQQFEVKARAACAKLNEVIILCSQ
jgi:hypothetical protein